MIARRMAAVAAQLRGVGHRVTAADAPAAVAALQPCSPGRCYVTGLAAVLQDRRRTPRPNDASAAASCWHRSSTCARSTCLKRSVEPHARGTRDPGATQAFDLILTPDCGRHALARRTEPSRPPSPASASTRAATRCSPPSSTPPVCPRLALPAAPSSDGLPIGLQLIGRRGADARCCALGLALRAATPAGRRQPLTSRPESRPP